MSELLGKRRWEHATTDSTLDWERQSAEGRATKKPRRHPKILYLADRNILIDEQYALSEFGEIEAKLRKLVDMTRKRNEKGEPDVGDIGR